MEIYSNLSTNGNSSTNQSIYNVEVLIIYGGVYPIIITVGCFGNILTLIVLRRQVSWLSTVFLQTLLTWADLVYLVIRAIYVLYKLGQLFAPELMFCASKVMTSYGFVVSAHMVSRLSKVALVLIGLERLSAVKNPKHFNKHWNKRRVTTLTAILVTPVVLCGIFQLSETIVTEQTSGETVTGRSTYEEMSRYLKFSTHFMTHFRLYSRILFDLLPLLLVFVCNVKMMVGIRQNTEHLRKIFSSSFRTRHAQERRSTKMLVTTSVVFLILCLPLDVSSFIISFGYDTSYGMHPIFTQIPVLLNHAINFIIYGLTNTVYRRHYIKILRCSRTRRHYEVGVNRFRIIQLCDQRTAITLC